MERGYRLGLEDYRNDLDMRGILELAGAADDEVQRTGRALEALLAPAERRVWESAPASPSGTSAIRATRAQIWPPI